MGEAITGYHDRPDEFMTISVGPFELIEPLGSGGMGAVWRGVHRSTAVPVAIKALTGETAEDPAFREEFEREVRAVAGLNHPGIITVYDYRTVPRSAERASEGRLVAGGPMLAMELADHGSLGDQTALSGWRQLRELLVQILSALAYAHARGVIHRDVKPTNILLTSTEHGCRRYKLTDFGIAHALDPYEAPSPRESGVYRGSPDYSPPEQLEGSWRDFGPWTDLYAVGCVAFELATGRPPFCAPSFVELAYAHMNHRRPSVDARFSVPAGFQEWVHCLLDPRIHRRFQRAADAARALEELSGESLIAHQTGEVTGEKEPIATGHTNVAYSPTRTSTEGAASAARRDRVEQMATIELPGEEVDRAPVVAPVEPPPLPKPTPQPNTDAERPDTDAWPPPFPASWRRLCPPKPIRYLSHAGLELFGIREVAFVGRDSERDRLWGLLDEVVATRSPRAALIRGPSGIGKSRLAKWMCRRAHELGAAHVLSASYTPHSEPSERLRAMLEQTFRCWHLAPTRVTQRVRRWLAVHAADGTSAGAFARELTEVLRPAHATDRRSDGPAPGQRQPDEIRRVLARFFAIASRQRPLVVWLDDACWSTTALGTVVELLEELPDIPVLFVLTARDRCTRQRATACERFAHLLRDEHLTQIELGPLRPPHRAELVEHLLTLAPDVARTLEERTAGNPLFAIEMVRRWVECDMLESTERGFVLREDSDAELPSSVRRLCRERLDYFIREHHPERADEVRRILGVAAALGLYVDPAEWRTGCKNLGLAIPEGLIGQLVRHRILDRTPDGLRFVHGAVRECVERAARQNGQWEEHQRNCTMILDELYGLESRHILYRRGRHLEWAGRLDEALKPYLASSRVARRAGDCSSSLRAIERAEHILDRLGPDDDARRVQTRLERAHLLRVFRSVYDHVEARRLTVEAERAATEHNWPLLRARALLERGRCGADRGKLSAACDSFEMAASLFARCGRPKDRVRALIERALSLRLLGRFHTVFTTLEQLRELRSTLDASTRALVAEPHALYYLDGPQRDLHRALAHATRFLEAARKHLGPIAQSRAHRLAGQAHRLSGRLERALDHHRRCYALASSADHLELSCAALLDIGMVYKQRGSVEQAQRWFRDSRLLMLRHGGDLWLALPLAGLSACEASVENWAAAEATLLAAGESMEGREGANRDFVLLCDSLAHLAARAQRCELAEFATRLAQPHRRVMDPGGELCGPPLIGLDDGEGGVGG